MSVLTDTRPATVDISSEQLAAVAADLDAVGDELIAGAIVGARVARVGGSRSASRVAIQSHTARAWTSGGNVD